MLETLRRLFFQYKRNLASLLHGGGNANAAIAHLRDLVRLSPGDSDVCTDLMNMYADEASPTEVDQAYNAYIVAVGTPNVLNAVRAAHEASAQKARVGLSARRQSRKVSDRADSLIPAIPLLPARYEAHNYALMQTAKLIGRRDEVAQLDGWLSDPAASPVLSLVAIGGAGKSALAWSWLTKGTPARKEAGLAGSLWWSFYEGEFRYEDFIERITAYVTALPIKEIKGRPIADIEGALFSALNSSKFLLVFDGVERIMQAYATAEAPYMPDEQIDSEVIAGRQAYRKSFDTRAGYFLRRLASITSSKTLLTSRLAPADLETAAQESLPGSDAKELRPMAPLDALALWNAIGARGDGAKLLRVFEQFDYHPLLVQALAGAVARWTPYPGDFDRWLNANPDFDIARLPAKQKKAHVLEFALRGAPEEALAVLTVLAAFRMPVSCDTAVSVTESLLGPGTDNEGLYRSFFDLVDRGLAGFDRSSRRSDLHPLVRAFAWSKCPVEQRRRIFSAIRAQLAGPDLQDGTYLWTKVNRLDDIAKPIELYNALVGEGKYDQAFDRYRQYLIDALKHRLKAYRLLSQLLEQLFMPGDLDSCRLSEDDDVYQARTDIAQAWACGGLPGRVTELFGTSYPATVNIRSLIACGRVYDAERAIRLSYTAWKENGDDFMRALMLAYLGRVQSLQGKDSSRTIGQCTEIRDSIWDDLYQHVESYELQMLISEIRLSEGKCDIALKSASLARKLLESANSMVIDEPGRQARGDYSWAACVEGLALTRTGDLDAADEKLNYSLTESRVAGNVEDEIRALIACAELKIATGDLRRTREFLDEAWEPIIRGPYRLFHADALLLRARIEISEGDTPSAAKSAAAAYRQAWCDGPDYAYRPRLDDAAAMLHDLGRDVPRDLPALDLTGKEPMPEI